MYMYHSPAENERMDRLKSQVSSLVRVAQSAKKQQQTFCSRKNENYAKENVTP